MYFSKNSLCKKILCPSLVACSLLACSHQESKEYYLNGDTLTGRWVPEKIVRSPVPLTMGYGEMSAEQRAVYRANYDDLPSDIEPPFPMRGLNSVLRPLISAQKQLQRSGELYLTAVVNGQGQVEAIEFYQAPTSDIAAAAAEALMGVEYKPARCSGKPCTMEFILNVELVVDGDLKRFSTRSEVVVSAARIRKDLSQAIIIAVPNTRQRTAY